MNTVLLHLLRLCFLMLSISHSASSLFPFSLQIGVMPVGHSDAGDYRGYHLSVFLTPAHHVFLLSSNLITTTALSSVTLLNHSVSRIACLSCYVLSGFLPRCGAARSRSQCACIFYIISTINNLMLGHTARNAGAFALRCSVARNGKWNSGRRIYTYVHGAGCKFSGKFPTWCMQPVLHGLHSNRFPFLDFSRIVGQSTCDVCMCAMPE